MGEISTISFIYYFKTSRFFPIGWIEKVLKSKVNIQKVNLANNIHLIPYCFILRSS